MSLNYVSLGDVARFREMIRLYDFQAAYDAQRAVAQQRLLDGILALRCTQRERMARGAPIRGVQIDLELHEDHFAGEGDAYLFASLVDRFMAAYATLNAFSQLNVRMARTGQIYAFPPRAGEQATPAEG
jgi:type VI secretion system protein ImpG